MKAKTAFSKKDLVVVLGCIAFLLANIAAVGKGGRNRAKQLVCLANLRQLGGAWLTFAQDNDGKLVNGDVPAKYSRYNPEKFWVEPPVNEVGLYVGEMSFCTFKDEKRGIERGLLLPYLKNTNIYHCPADDRYTRRPGDPRHLKKDGGFRSYSIAGCLNGEEGVNQNNYNITLYSQIKSPADKYVFVEEGDPRGYNRGSWILQAVDNLNIWDWTDPVAAWHNKQCALGFSDGHAEMHKWLDQRTIKLATTEDWNIIRMIRKGQFNNPDLVYMKKHYAHKGKMGN